MQNSEHDPSLGTESKIGTNKEKLLRVIKNFVTLLAVMAVCTAISMLLRHFGAHETNIVMLYLLGILGFSYLAGSYFYSLAASMLGVLLYNFFFTEPYYTFLAYSPDYPMTFLIMFFVGSFTSMLTIRIRHETLLAEEREERIKALYQIGRRLLEVKSSDDLAEVASEAFAQQFSASVLVQFTDAAGNIRNRHVTGEDIFSDEKEQAVCLKAYRSQNPCGSGTRAFPDAGAYYVPIISQSGVLGVIGIAPDSQSLLTYAQMEFVDTISPQIAVVLEREMLYRKQEETQIQIQHERLRANMLRAISHDLRTPLTGIMGSASTVIDNYDLVSDEIKKSFLTNIYDEAAWLNELVENILNMTRFDEGKIKLNIGQEAAEEIITEAIGHVRKRSTGHIIRTDIPAEIVLFEADGVLITQVLVNLLDNAINYTPEGSIITASLRQSEDAVIFEVTDNGPGILEEDIPHMFERLYTRISKPYGARHGFGLGLSLCKSIVEAHGGKISITNTQPHGTSVIFNIPKKGA
jgi:two-component system, OmpR family, sensor histidine kinase KdpD